MNLTLNLNQMEKLLKLNPEERYDRYFYEFGRQPEINDDQKITAALIYGKPIHYLSAEEIDSINEY